MALINNKPFLDALGGTTPQYRYPDSLGTPPFEKWILFQVKPANHINRNSGNLAAVDPDFTIASVALYLTPEALSSTLTANYDSSGYGIVGGAAMDASMQAGVESMKVLGGTQSLTEGLGKLGDVVNAQTTGAAGKALSAKLASTLAEDVGLDTATLNKLAGTFGSKTLNPRVDLFYQNTEKILNDIPEVLGKRFRLTEWNLPAVIDAAKRSHRAVLPLDPYGTLNPLKAENRLLMMWRIGLPTLASPSLAYTRVMRDTQIDGICHDANEWQMKVTELMNSVELRKESVEKGQQYIRETHSEKMVLEAWDKLFESVL
jgi:hypothetical protein